MIIWFSEMEGKDPSIALSCGDTCCFQQQYLGSSSFQHLRSVPRQQSMRHWTTASIRCHFNSSTKTDVFLPAIVDSIPTTWTRFWWNTAYSPKNHTESDDLWEAILPSHGFVAMDRKWAKVRQWPESMYLPSDHGKGVYLLEAYHQLHCLVCPE